jgi:hypothetical protein
MNDLFLNRRKDFYRQSDRNFFNVFWGALQAALAQPTYILNWTVDSGHLGVLGGDFIAVSQENGIFCKPSDFSICHSEYLSEVSFGCFEVDFHSHIDQGMIVKKMKGILVSQDNFWGIWKIWDLYLTGDISPENLHSMKICNSKYVVSIYYHFMETWSHKECK